MFTRTHTSPLTRVQKLALTALTALALTAGVAAANAQASAELAGDPSQWGMHSLAKKGSFDITEVGGAEERLIAGGTDKGGDVPVVTG